MPSRSRPTWSTGRTRRSPPPARSSCSSPSSAERPAPPGAPLSPEPLVLASRSPQRRAILQQLGVEFRVVVPKVDELTEGPPGDLVVENAARKRRAVEEEVSEASGGGRQGPARVLAADTAVAVDGRGLGKPRDEVEAEGFLRLLSGRSHEVWSGLALKEDGQLRDGRALTQVAFRALGERELRWYLATGEWRERAGGYAIQGRGAALVEAIQGDFWNVVGLPIAELLRLSPGLLWGGSPPHGTA